MFVRRLLIRLSRLFYYELIFKLNEIVLSKYLFIFIMKSYFGDSCSKNHFIRTWMEHNAVLFILSYIP